MKKYFPIEIYGRHLYVIVIDDKDSCSDIESRYGLDNVSKCNGFALKVIDSSNSYVLILNPSSKGFQVGTIAHESVHIAQFIINDIGDDIKDNNMEQLGYLTGFIFNKAYDMYNKNINSAKTF